MKKKLILKTISMILLLVAIFAVICAITVRGGGFLDLSDIVRKICIGTAIVCTLISVLIWKYSK